MFESDRPPPLPRRSFLSRLSAGAVAFGAAVAGGTSTALAQSAGSGAWKPVRHDLDNWLDELPGGHRLVFDATTAEGLQQAMMYSHNYFLANESAYQLKPDALAVVIIARHTATVFAYNDAMWAKYPLAQLVNFTDRRTKESPTTNVYRTGRDSSLEGLTKRGVRIAVCEMATKVFSEGLARRTSGDAEAIFKDLMANLIPNTHSVSAGIVTVNRAQERGYTLAHGG